MSATFGDVPVSAIFDGNAATSSFSLEWVMGSGLRTRNSRASGLLSLPCNTGFIFMCLNDIPVAASSPSDLVLGLDWFQFVCNSTSELVVHLSSGPLDLRHHPLPTVGGESAASLSIGSSSVIPVFRGDIGVDPSSSSSASRGRPDVVLTHSCTPVETLNWTMTWGWVVGGKWFGTYTAARVLDVREGVGIHGKQPG
ncbi:hypothetical protein B0H13DRAFT_2689710 [Mycena leptocephala]|nr:hypothetical protein B0H13DRAFT_2689710 [Mycena leptocephala]